MRGNERDQQISDVRECVQNLGLARLIEARTNKINVSDADKLAVLLLEILEVNCRERFEHASESALHPLCSLCNTAHKTGLASKKNDDTIRLGQVIAFQDETFCFAKRHQAKG
jgi:hypothetical protein